MEKKSAGVERRSGDPEGDPLGLTASRGRGIPKHRDYRDRLPLPFTRLEKGGYPLQNKKPFLIWCFC